MDQTQGKQRKVWR